MMFRLQSKWPARHDMLNNDAVILHHNKLRQHLCYVYASLSRPDFLGHLEKGTVVFECLTGFLAVKKPTALMMHRWNGGRGGVCTTMRCTTNCSTFCLTSKAGATIASRILAQNASTPSKSRSSAARSRRCCSI